MSEKHKSTSPSATPIKKQHKAMSIEEKLDIIHRLKKVNKLLISSQLLAWPRAACIQFVIMQKKIEENSYNCNTATVIIAYLVI
jgi:hypothetical protein